VTRVRISGMLAVTLALAACSSSGNPAAAPVSAGAVATTSTAVGAARTGRGPTTDPGCRPAAAFGPGTPTHHLTVAGADRVFLVHMPPHPKADMHLIVDFDGATSDMQQQDIYSGFDPLADRDGFVVVTPNGIDAPIRQWRFLGTSDDVAFAVAIVRSLVHDGCVDPARAYATGISSGGAMTASLACQASDTFAAFAMVAADFYLPPICDRARSRPIMIFHGTADPVVPYFGGHVGTPTGLPVQPAEKTAAAWAHHNGCAPVPTRAHPSAQVIRLTWQQCRAPVVMYRIEGGGHTWPGAAIHVERLGLTTGQINATDEMWQFFDAN